MDVEAEIRDLKRRVGDLEGAVNVLSSHIGRVRPDLAALSAASAARFDTVEDLVGKVAARLDTLNTQVWSLRDDLPEMIATAMQRGNHTSR